MTLEERLKNNAPAQSKANLKGGDKTKLEADGGLDLSKDQKAIEKAGGGKLGQGSAGFKPGKPYSDTFK
jgi:hypothetical protein|tara:strand:- start:782 stop:988 length:207 start_codon:yes stop_codon:yes gene_type:complete